MRIFVRIVKGVVVTAAAFALYLLTVALIPGISAPPQPLKRPKPREDSPQTQPAGDRRDLHFLVANVPVAAWFYPAPAHNLPAPCVVMAHGLGGTRDMGLDTYARRFQTAGYAVLVFDYRHFGASDGEPRQLIWIPDQLADWAGAVAHARSLSEVDATRIALWGASLAGGHVIVTAARDPGIACVAALCPGLDGRASAEMMYQRAGLGSLRLIVHAQRDLVRSWLGLSPHTIPIVGEPGTLALMTTPDAYAAFSTLAPDSFVNKACARIVIRGDKYRPVTYAGQVRCPVLLQVCDNDDLTPASAAVETARKLGGRATMVHYPLGHFDIYFGDNLQRSIDDQLQFFHQHLG